MTTKKYRSYGIRRENNLSDINNKEDALNNLLNNMPGVGGDISFASQDLDAIRGLSDTAISASDFIGLASSMPRITVVDEIGVQLVDSNGDPLIQIIQPIYRIEDRIRSYRRITENPPVFASGTGPYAYFIPSNLIPALTKGSNLNSINIDAVQTNVATIRSEDFWSLGEFSISNKIRQNFPNEYGGILWEGYYIPNPINTTHSFGYETTGLFHVEYDRFGNNSWEVVKSIYAKQRTVTVAVAATNATTIQLVAGDTRYVSRNDFIASDATNLITGISGNSIFLTKPITAAVNSTITLDMDLGQKQYAGNYVIDEVLDRAETPQIKKRIFWWYPFSTTYTPDIKYLRNILFSSRAAASNRAIYDYFNWNKERSSLIAIPGSIRDVLRRSITPSQDNFGSAGKELFFRSNVFTDTIYTPKSSFVEINKVITTVSFQQGSRYIEGANALSLSPTEIGNVVVPAVVAAVPSETFNTIPKNLRIKNLIGTGTDSTFRLVDQPTPVTGSASVNVIDHLGLIDYFVASSVGDLVTVSNTANLKKDMICITSSTLATSYVRITEILPVATGVTPTQFRTSEPLNLTNGFVYIYANSGIIDRSLEIFCTGVFGQAVAATAQIGNTLQLVSTTGVAIDQAIQFINAIPAGTTVTAIDEVNNIITLSANTTAIIIQGETVVFAPVGTSVNKEICVLPLDLSPPFVGVTSGLSTNGKGIEGLQPVLNIRTNKLTFKNTTVNTALITESFDRKIELKNINPLTGTNFSILGKLVI